MPICSRCGVEVEEGLTYCPLCQKPLQGEPLKEPLEPAKKFPQEPPPTKKTRTNKQKRLLTWEILSVTLLTLLLITMFLDLIINRTITWSLYAIASIILVWILFTCPLLFPKKLVVLFIGETIPYFIYLLILDLADNRAIDWYLKLGLPILGVIIIIGIAIAVGSIFLKNKGLNIVALIVFGSGAICLGIDFIVNYYLRQKFTATWSLFVLASTVVVGAFLIYLHFRLLKGANLKRKLQM